MPQSIVIAIPRHKDPRTVFVAPSQPPWSLARIHTEASPFEISFQANDLGWYVSISEMQDPDDVALDYMTNEDIDEAFRVDAPTKSFFLLSFNDYQIARDFLLTILASIEPELRDYWIDNDYGVVLNGRELLEKLRSNPTWDWRVGSKLANDDR